MKSYLAILSGLWIIGAASALQAENTTNQTSPEITAAFERCRKICSDIEKVRGLSFTNKVAIEVQSLQDFEKYIETEVDREYGSEAEQKNYVNALVMLGALKEQVDFKKSMVEFLKSQAAAHYDPVKKKYFLLMTGMTQMALDAVSAHELCHALQDQHFDLKKMAMDDPLAIRHNSDAGLALQSMFEGDAMLVMTAWLIMDQNGSTWSDELWPMTSMMIGAQASMDFDAIFAVLTNGTLKAQTAMDTTGSIEQMQKCPRIFSEAMLSAYMQGSAMINRVRAKDGWNAVNALYKTPPQSTEQILHPDKLLEKRDIPVDAGIKDLQKKLPAGWKVAEYNVLGELGMKIYFEIWRNKAETGNVPGPISATSGWGGDTYYYLQNAAGDRSALVWNTIWDTTKDADEFAAAYEASLKARFPELKEEKPHKLWKLKDNRRLRMTKNTLSVIIADSTEEKILELAK